MWRNITFSELWRVFFSSARKSVYTLQYDQSVVIEKTSEGQGPNHDNTIISEIIKNNDSARLESDDVYFPFRNLMYDKTSVIHRLFFENFRSYSENQNLTYD